MRVGWEEQRFVFLCMQVHKRMTINKILKELEYKVVDRCINTVSLRLPEASVRPAGEEEEVQRGSGLQGGG